MRKVGGDKAADGFLAAMRHHARRADRCRSRSASAAASRMPAFWSRQTENTLDRATAMMPTPALRPPGRVRHRLRHHLSDRRPAPAAHQRRRDAARGDPRLQHRLGRLFPRARRPHDAGGDHPDASPRTRRSPSSNSSPSNSARRSAMFGSDMSRRGAGGRGQRSGHGALRRLVRRARHRQPLRLRPGLGEMRRTGHRADLPQHRQQPGRCATRRPTSSTTISAISPPPAMPSPRRSSSAASPGASPSCASPSWKAASAGRASCSAI